MIDYQSKFREGLPYGEFLARYASDAQRRRWDEQHAQIRLSAGQLELLRGFVRELNVLCLAGTWCGDCVHQCPIFDHFETHAERLSVRYLDRDDHPDTHAALGICGAPRVPSLVFLNEDFQLVGRYGDRTLAKYRQMAAEQLGDVCPIGANPDDGLLGEVTQEWLSEFERIHLMLRMSPRLRERHGD